jgi:glycogen debranching enzyme
MAFEASPHQIVNIVVITKATRSAATVPIIRVPCGPGLMGPFLTAYFKVNGRSAKTRRQAEQWLTELRAFIQHEGVGQVPEVFDGDAPHCAGGCLAQAWSVAELLRICVEELPAAKPARRVAATAS